MTYYQQQLQQLQARLYPQPEVGDRLRRARHLIDRQFADPLDLGQLAAAACYSRFHFLRQFKRYYGCTPHEYLRTVRLAHARRALLAGQSVRDVCFAAGFDSVSSFSGLFREWAGCSPAAFRQRRAKSNFGEAGS
ncbi:helix-turn-helix domain-containing protein [Hymenobacter ruricola]|uniref:Helix-turn-helix transcriptional regulator n=1 Tax=Hymenobacter ruricola TaxID=2791023 RepID=A0ABS0ICS2_9BACT|nr:AraC family transcriptional regulator [Hymenobacter ruricola]MBF9224264.1 helix-turn-helix transcriptional regulator [Hymenobacter ruricola]